MKLSVIVPVYNVEKYLAQCLTSIVDQTYRDLEIIIVDDGSTDNSLQICEGFAANDSRISVIHQINGGVSVARNTGIEVATGDYLTFVDSDDWLDNEMYEKMVEQIKKSPGLDIVMCDSTLFTKNFEIKSTDFIRKGHYSKPQIVSELYPVLLVTEDLGKIPIISACTILIKRDILVSHLIRFDQDLRYGEDYLFMPEVMIHTHSFYYLKGTHYYHYRQYEGSRSKKLQPDWWLNFLDLNKKLKDLLADSTEFDFTRQLKLQLIHSALFLTGAIYNNKDLHTDKKVYLLRKLFNEPELKAAFSNLDFNKQSLALKLVLYLTKRKMALSYLMYRNMVDKIKIKFEKKVVAVL